MKTINYYDRIHQQTIEIEVNDEVARFLSSSERNFKRQEQQARKMIAFSLDEITTCDGFEALPYEELIEDKTANLTQNFEQKEFANIVWNVVEKLEEKQAKMIKGLFKFCFSPKELAEYFDMSPSAFSQFKETTFKHLHILFSYDEKFRQTDFYQSHYKDFADSVIKQSKQELNSNKISINLNNVFELIKNVTQFNKITEKIGIAIPQEVLETLNYMTKPVLEFLKSLKKSEKLDDKKVSFLNIDFTNLK